MGKIFIFILLCSLDILSGQNNPRFSKFIGDVIYLEEGWKPEYGSHVHSANTIATVSWDSLVIPSIRTAKPFNGKNFGSRFGIIFKSEMIISDKGRYEFSLSSDDGSRLWIGQEEIINNDGIHKMNSILDTINLNAGSYPIQIWYFQAGEDRYGLIFKSKYLSSIIEEMIELNAELLFPLNSSTLNPTTTQFLLKELSKLDIQNVQKIEIHGHTCSDGTEESNMKLSMKRAIAVKNIIMGKHDSLLIETIAHGESQPKYNNLNDVEKNKNRRIELVFKYKN